MSLGLLLLGLGFALGTGGIPISTANAGQSPHCANVIPTGWLVSGEPKVPDTRTPGQRRLDARMRAKCHPAEVRARWEVWGVLGLGALILLTGWTALREREHDEEIARRTPVPA